MSGKFEAEFKKRGAEMLSKLCNDSNQTTEIGTLQEYRDYCNLKKKVGCYNCLSLNCWIRQKVSKGLIMSTNFDTKCPKKRLTLS